MKKDDDDQMETVTGFIMKVSSPKCQLKLNGSKLKRGKKQSALTGGEGSSRIKQSSRESEMTSSPGSQPELNHRSYSYVRTSTDLRSGFVLFICLFHT